MPVAQVGVQVVAGLAHRQGGQAKAEGGVGDAEIKRLGAQPVPGGDVAGGQRGDGDRDVTCGLVEAHRQAAAFRSGQVDLHDDRVGPGQTLVRCGGRPTR